MWDSLVTSNSECVVIHWVILLGYVSFDYLDFILITHVVNQKLLLFTSDTDVSLRPHCPEIMWSSHPLSLIISFILDVTFSSSVFICLSAWRPRLTSDQCRRICEFLKVWRGKSLQGVGHWYCLVLQACVCVCRLVYGEPIIRVSTANSALVLGSAGRLLSHQLWQHNTSSPFLSLSMLFLFFSTLAIFKLSSRFGRKNKSKAKELGALSEEEVDKSEPEMFLSKYVYHSCNVYYLINKFQL